MSHLTESIGFVAPYYNMILVAIAIALFIMLLKKPGKENITPWKLMFISILIYVFEEVLTILNDLDIINLSKLVAPLLEMAIISIFIYVFLSQLDYLKGKQKC